MDIAALPVLAKSRPVAMPLGGVGTLAICQPCVVATPGPAFPTGVRGRPNIMRRGASHVYNKPIKAFIPAMLLGLRYGQFFRAGVKWLTGLSQLCP
jgi:hypothetical protein